MKLNKKIVDKNMELTQNKTEIKEIKIKRKIK
jgi:hypothetical protein